MDYHHISGKANSPLTIPVPVNDHRAKLSVDQYDWPNQTLENPSRSPLLARAACNRGFADTSVYLIEELLIPGAEMLEILDEYLVNKLGPEWWIGTELARFRPK